ncbi:MAG: hypothetical protein M1827_005754 [Pycnora praestabilis]|nr:MAG: hypothetical protein M1827_005754 [Pycnora praestabilis]
MHTCSRRHLFHNLEVLTRYGHDSVSVPQFLVPEAAYSPSTSTQWSDFTRRQRVRFTSTQAAGKYSAQSFAPMFESFHPKQPTLNWSSGRWRVAKLDGFLPPQLRLDQNDGVTAKPLKDLPRFLAQARQVQNIDLLNYIGVQEGRWQAVIWIVKNLLDRSSYDQEVARLENCLSNLAWNNADTLERATVTAIWAENGVRKSESRTATLNELTASMGGHSNKDSYDLERDALKQIWQSLGSMILTAADSEADEARRIMSVVLQIIAYLHHINLVPATLYSYSMADESSTNKRPPTLHLLSSRILTSLSDATWRAHEDFVKSEAAAIGAEYVYKGHEVPGARYKLKVRELGPQVWLDLVLWSCVEEGFIPEGTWIVQEMKKRFGDHKWSVLNWKAVQDPSDHRRRNPARVDWEGIQGRTGGVVGRIEGYSADRPFVELGDRTVSSEVLAALIDGLISTLRTGVGDRGLSFGTVYRNIAMLRDVLEVDHFNLEIGSLHQLILRLLESHGVDPNVDPGVLETILKLAPFPKPRIPEATNVLMHDKDRQSPSDQLNSINYNFEQVLSESTPSSHQPHQGKYQRRSDYHQSAIVRELFLRLLTVSSRAGDIRGALRAFTKLQDYLDMEKRKSINEFIMELQRRTASDADFADLEPEDSLIELPETYQPIPAPVLAALLKVVTDSKAHQFGRWLMNADDFDGSIIPEYMYGSPIIAPELLRFAAATKDPTLTNKVADAMRPPLSEPLLHALLQTQINLRQWDGVENILEYLQHKSNFTTPAWSAADATTFAKVILELRHDNLTASSEFERTDNAESLKKAKDIFTNLLRGHYSTPTNRSGNKYRNHHNDRKYLIAMFKSSRTLLAKLCPGEDAPANLSAIIIGTKPSCHAFNIFLEGIVSTQGSHAGRKMWSQWCLDPTESFQRQINSGIPQVPRVRTTDHNESKIPFAGYVYKPTADSGLKAESRIMPNLVTLRIITQAALNERQEAITILGHQANNIPSEGSAQREADDVPYPVVQQSVSINTGVAFNSTRTNRFAVEASVRSLRKVQKDSSANIILWAASMFRGFGLSEENIEKELGGFWDRKNPGNVVQQPLRSKKS